MAIMQLVIEKLEECAILTAKYKTHLLKGQYADLLECHIKGECLLVWLQSDEAKEITFTGTGTYSDLF